MLALEFQIARNRFALLCSNVVELVPRVELRKMPHAPAAIAGVFTYRGAIVPVIDLTQLMHGIDSAVRLSTRIALVNVVVRSKRGMASRIDQGATRTIGLLAEQMCDTIVLDKKAAIDDGIHLVDAPYLGDVYLQGGSAVQLLLIEELLCGPLEQLFDAAGDLP
jgi:chemotaxis-related protein WspB